MVRVGFVGLGNIGQPMTRALLRAGLDVVVLDAVPEKAEPCVAEGARAVTRAQELVDCDVVALAVPDDDAVEACCGMWSPPPGPPASRCPWPDSWPSYSLRGSRTTRAASSSR